MELRVTHVGGEIEVCLPFFEPLPLSGDVRLAA